MPLDKIQLNPDEEIRSEMVRLYLEPEQAAILRQLQSEVMAVTNHIVRSRRDVKDASIAYALRHGLVGPAPTFPRKPELPTPVTDEEKKAVKTAWSEFRTAEKKARKAHVAWVASVLKAVKNVPECKWRQDDYKVLRKIYGRIGSAVLYRDTVKRVMRTKGARPKKVGDRIPLEWANSPLPLTGEFYGDRRGQPFYNILVRITKFGCIKGRLRRPLPGKPVQGLALIKEPDGWYAAIKCVVKKKPLPVPTLPPIGMDVGQTDLVSLSDGYSKYNDRDAKFLRLKARIQKKAGDRGDRNLWKDVLNTVSRLDQSRKRRVHYWVNSELIPKLSQHEKIFVEDLTKGFKFNHGSVSSMHTILRAVRNKFGDRVVSVDRKFTSQVCSACGNLEDKQRKGKNFTCLNDHCGLCLDADINAARNILARGLETQT